MQIQITKPEKITIEVPFNYPLYRSRLMGDYNVGNFKKEYWKFESKHKVTKITEEMCQTTILTYDDMQADFISELMSERMLYGQYEYDIIPEKTFEEALQRLINQIHRS